MEINFVKFCENVSKKGFIKFEIYPFWEFYNDIGCFRLCAFDGKVFFIKKYLFKKTLLKKYRLRLDAKTMNFNNHKFEEVFNTFHSFNIKKNFRKRLNKILKYCV